MSVEMSAAAVDDVKRHGRQTREAQRASCRWRHVDDPAAHEWSAVVDPDDHRATTVLVGYAHERSKWKSSVSGGHAARAGSFATCRPAPRINGGDSQLGLSDGRSAN